MWEVGDFADWLLAQGAVKGESRIYAGFETVVRFQKLLDMRLGAVRGRNAWGQTGISITVMGSLKRSIYLGSKFFDTLSVIVPKDPADLLPLYAMASSNDFFDRVRGVDRALSVTDSSFEKVPFDREFWTSKANEIGALPEPYSEDPTQWLFHGHPANSDNGTALHIALARLCG